MSGLQSLSRTREPNDYSRLNYISTPLDAPHPIAMHLEMFFEAF
jgi:hypothetical protein